MEQGHFYKAEAPSSYHKGQTGDGVSIGGKVQAKSGSPLEVGKDSYASKIKGEWNSAGKGSRFPSL